MLRLTLRTLLAYLDDTLSAADTKAIGLKVSESQYSQDLIDKIKIVTRRRGLSTPVLEGQGTPSDPNIVADYLSDTLPADQVADFEKACLDSDAQLAEAAACHQILTLLLSEPVRVPPTARQRMYQLVTGPESLPQRKPGATVPIGGVVPQTTPSLPDETDAALLLGLKAYSRSDTPRIRVAKWLGLLGVASGLAASIWFSWPEALPKMPDAGRGEVATVVPAANAKGVEKKPDSKQDAKTNPRDTDKTTLDGVTIPVAPMPVTSKPSEPTKSEPMAPKPEVPKPDEPKPEKPPVAAATMPIKTDRLALAKLENAEGLLAVQNGAGVWTRIIAGETQVFSTDTLISLPGYKSRLILDSGPMVELWGNLPDQTPVAVLESAIRLHPAYDGFAADLSLVRGRIYLSTKTAGTRIRVRTPADAWDVTLEDDKSEVVIEVVQSLAHGLTLPIESPVVQTVTMSVLRGKASLAVAGKPAIAVPLQNTVAWSSQMPGLVGPTKPETTTTLKESAYFNRFPVYANENYAKGVQLALTELASKCDSKDSVRVRLDELIAERKELTLNGLIRARVGVFGHAALDDSAELIDALHDVVRPTVRDAAVVGLASWCATKPDGLGQFQKLLVEKNRCNEQEAELSVTFLRGVTPAERTDPVVIEKFVEGLGSSALSVREIAFWVLKNDIDADARAKPALLQIDFAGNSETRRIGLELWRSRAKELIRKLDQNK